MEIIKAAWPSSGSGIARDLPFLKVSDGENEMSALRAYA